MTPKGPSAVEVGQVISAPPKSGAARPAIDAVATAFGLRGRGGGGGRDVMTPSPS